MVQNVYLKKSFRLFLAFNFNSVIWTNHVFCLTLNTNTGNTHLFQDWLNTQENSRNFGIRNSWNFGVRISWNFGVRNSEFVTPRREELKFFDFKLFFFLVLLFYCWIWTLCWKRRIEDLWSWFIIFCCWIETCSQWN